MCILENNICILRFWGFHAYVYIQLVTVKSYLEYLERYFSPNYKYVFLVENEINRMSISLNCLDVILKTLGNIIT